MSLQDSDREYATREMCTKTREPITLDQRASVYLCHRRRFLATNLLPFSYRGSAAPSPRANHALLGSCPRPAFVSILWEAREGAVNRQGQTRLCIRDILSLRIPVKGQAASANGNLRRRGPVSPKGAVYPASRDQAGGPPIVMADRRPGSANPHQPPSPEGAEQPFSIPHVPLVVGNSGRIQRSRCGGTAISPFLG
jgi:hypothetical protein